METATFAALERVKLQKGQEDVGGECFYSTTNTGDVSICFRRHFLRRRRWKPTLGLASAFRPRLL